MVDRLLPRGTAGRVRQLFDGQRRFLESAMIILSSLFMRQTCSTGTVWRGRCKELNSWSTSRRMRTYAWHRASAKGLEQNTIATWNVLEAMRETRLQRMYFRRPVRLRRARYFPTPRPVRFPFRLALRSLQTGRGRPDPGLLRRLRNAGLYLSFRLDPWRALLARACV